MPSLPHVGMGSRPESKSPADPLHVLLIEDNPGDVRLVEEMLSEGPLEVSCRTTSSLEDGIATARDAVPDVFLVDLGLPDSEGTTTVRRCIEAFPHVPLVVLTGQGGMEAPLRAQEAGAADFLQKGELTPQLLARTLRWAVRETRLEEQIQERETQIRGVANSLPGVIFQLIALPDGTRGFRFMSDQAEQMLGISSRASDRLDLSLSQIPSPHNEEVRRSIDRAVEAEEAWQREFPFRVPDGEQIWLLGVATPERKGDELVFNGVLLDITERKQAEEDLRKERALLEQAQRLAGAWEVDLENEEVTWSQKVYEIYGKDPGEPVSFNETFAAFPNEEDAQAQLREAFTRCAEEGEPYDLKLPLETGEGDRQWIRTVGAPMEEENGSAKKVVGAIQPISELRETEEALSDRESRLRGLANSVPGGIFQFEVFPDGEQSFTFVSEQAEALLGISSEPEGYFERFVQQVPPSHRQDLLDSIGEAIQDSRAWSFEMPFDRPDGERIWVRGVSTPERRTTPEGDKLVYHGVTIDTTERKQAEQKLRRNRSRLETAQEIAGLGSWERDLDSGEMVWSDEMYDIFGWDPEEEVTLEKIMDALPPEDQEKLRRRREQAIEAGGTFQLEHRLTRPDGEVRIVRMNGKAEQIGPEDAPRTIGTSLDITRQKRHEQEIERLRRKYEGLLEGAPDAIFVAEADTGRITEVNNAAAVLIGASTGDIVGRHISDMHPADQAAHFKGLFRRAGETPETLSRFEDGTQAMIVTDDGAHVPVEASLTAVTLEDDQYVVGIFRDIRERRKIERRYEAIFNQTFQFTGLMETDGTVIEANDTALDVGNLQAEDVVGRPIWETFWFQTGDEARERVREAVQTASSGEFVRYEEEVQTAEGRITIDFSIRPLRDDDGEVRLLIPEGRDITERKQQEKEAQRRAQAMAAASDGMAILNAEGQYTFVNKAHAQIYGYESPDALLGHSWRRCYGDEATQRLEEEVMPTLEAQGAWQGETTGRRADGTSFDQSLTLTALDDGGIICVVRDITDRKERERTLRAAKREAEEASRLKSTLLANMSHEFRTPLTSILGFSDAIRREMSAVDIEDLDEEVATAVDSAEHFAELIRKGGERLQNTLTSVLKLSKLEAQETDLTLEPCNVTEALQGTVASARAQAEEADLAFQIEYPEESVWAKGHPSGLNVALEKLVGNAIKFTDPGGDVVLRVRAEPDTAVIEIEDSGIGMDPDEVERLFQAFEQESEGMDREYEGSGLGLAVARKLVTMMGGTIEVETTKGEGSRISIRLPKAETS